jgi:hypothetical protein
MTTPTFSYNLFKYGLGCEYCVKREKYKYSGADIQEPSFRSGIFSVVNKIK